MQHVQSGASADHIAPVHWKISRDMQVVCRDAWKTHSEMGRLKDAQVEMMKFFQ